MRSFVSLVLLLSSTLGCSRELPSERSDGAVRVAFGEGSDQNPCLSPDGLILVFTRFSRGYNDGPAALIALELATGVEEVLVDDGDHDHVNLPGRCFSPDGQQLAYSSDAEDRDEIWLLDLRTRETRRLTDHPGDQAFEPAFSRDGAQVVFELLVEERRGSIHAISTVGTDERTLTDGADDRQPNPSPVDDTVLYQSNRGGTWGLWTVPLAGGEPSVLLDSSAEETDASWSPDGGVVVFATDDCGALSCAATFREGDVEVHDTPAGWYEGAPAMSSDGTIYVEASDEDPDEGGETAIYRLP